MSLGPILFVTAFGVGVALFIRLILRIHRRVRVNPKAMLDVGNDPPSTP
jgi:hypothetical protein